MILDPVTSNSIVLKSLNSYTQQATLPDERQFCFPLSVDHLLTLIQYNVFRAILANMTFIEVSLDEMSYDETASLFNPGARLKNLPLNLPPTKLQKEVIYHSFINI